MMKTAIYGGSFNPPHLGHRAVAETVMSELVPDRLIIMPDCSAPHKEMASNSPEPEQRLEMCRIAFGGIERVEISDIEIRRGGKSYTIDTLTRLKELYPDDEFYLVMGSDMFLSFTTGWYRFQDILELCTLTILSREENDMRQLEDFAGMMQKNYGAKIVMIKNHRTIVLSSSEIREALKCGKGEKFLDIKVYNYVKEKRLYT